MSTFKEMNGDFIINWCVENKKTAWLKEITSTPIATKDGGERAITFIEIKKAFCAEFMPEIMPKAKPTSNFFQRVMNLPD